MDNAVQTTSRDERDSRLHYRVLAAVLILAAGSRIALALWLPSEPIWRDGATHYARVVEHILAEGQYPVHDSSSAPLLPLVLAAIYWVFGFNGTAARVVMALFGTLTCVILYSLARRLFGRSAGLVACAMLALYPLHVYMSGMHELAQPIFIMLLCLAVHQFVSFSETPDSRYKLVMSGLAFGLGVMTVPTILTAVPFLTIWLLFLGRQTHMRRLVNAAIFAVACAFVVLSWSAYVYARTGNFQLGSGAGTEALFNGNCSLAWPIGKADIADVYAVEGVPAEYEEAYEEHEAVMRQARTVPEGVARNAVFRDAVKCFFIERPGEATLLLLRKGLLYWCPYALTATRHSHNNGLTQVVQITAFMPILVLALVGVYSQRKRIAPLVPIYLVVLSQWATYTIYFPTMRYRSHIDMLLIVMGAPVVVVLAEKIISVAARKRAQDGQMLSPRPEGGG